MKKSHQINNLLSEKMTFEIQDFDPKFRNISKST